MCEGARGGRGVNRGGGASRGEGGGWRERGVEEAGERGGGGLPHSHPPQAVKVVASLETALHLGGGTSRGVGWVGG